MFVLIDTKKTVIIIRLGITGIFKIPTLMSVWRQVHWEKCVETDPQDNVFLKYIFRVSIISPFQFDWIANFMYLDRINMQNCRSSVTRMISVILDDNFEGVE